MATLRFGKTQVAPRALLPAVHLPRGRPDSLKEFQDVIWVNSHSGQRQYPI